MLARAMRPARAQAAYIRVPQAARREMAERGLPFREGLHAASHALINVVPLFLLCNATDLGSECDNPYDTRFRPERLLIFDKHPGGIGLAKQVAASPVLRGTQSICRDALSIDPSGLHRCRACAWLSRKHECS